jgi:streptomycin 3"-adenylyltransferase
LTPDLRRYRLGANTEVYRQRRKGAAAMTAGQRVPGEVATYARRLAHEVSASCGGRLVGGYLHGSAALGGWIAARSDVDMLFVLRDDTPRPLVSAVEEVLVAHSRACPGRGLETSVISVQQAGDPGAPWPFLVHVQASHGHEPRRVSGDAVDGDRDLLIHYAVCRAAGVSVLGPDPAEAFGVVPRSAILAYLSDELRWGSTHGTEAYAVLNACRALVYAAHDEFVSKTDGGQLALDRGLGPRDVIARSLQEQRGQGPPGLMTSASTAFVEGVADYLGSSLRFD